MSDVSASELRLVTDKAAIDALIQGWMFRDIGPWDKLRTLFHPDGTRACAWMRGFGRRLPELDQTQWRRQPDT